MRGVERPVRLLRTAELQCRLTATAQRALPLLVVRLPALERTAWREGLRKARTLERRACAAFSAAATRTLRAEDHIAHDPGSDVFIAALTAPTRVQVSAEIAVDARSALARMAASIEDVTRLEVEPGWTTLLPHETQAMPAIVERALARGVQERERYAFFSALGHELRTPLASIRGYLETLLDDTTVDERTRTRFLEIAYKESLRLARLVEGMFEISLLDLQTTRSAHACGALDSALDAAADACAANAAGRSLTLVRSRLEPTLVGLDGDRLTLVLINLLENAIKHGRFGGSICVRTELVDGFARVTIDDDGPGIPPADRERIFRFGERGDTAADGSGIGLAFVRLMLERAGGRVAVSDSPAGGARFTIHLPRFVTTAAAV